MYWFRREGNGNFFAALHRQRRYAAHLIAIRDAAVKPIKLSHNRSKG
jgi:hypothetical protein